MSSKNPFRSSSPPLPPLPPPSPTSAPSASASLPASAAPSGPLAPSGLDNIDDDLPPPYTPAANLNIGEETLSLGPRRPFQQPPPIPSSSFRPPSNWPPPPPPPLPQRGPSSGFYAQPSPAPWQTQQQYRQRPKQSGGLIGALLDTVRDIADVVSGAHDERMMATQSINASAYAAPQPSARTMYAPPPSGPPMQAYEPPPGPPPPRPVSAPPRSPPAIPDDGSPTRTPVPGHPLLLDGNLLVYPRDHLCVKCKNTGYKNYDPSHPCRKCWDKYGRPYTGVLSYTPWAPSGNDPRMQRPLPKFVPPHLAGLSSGSHRLRQSELLPPPRHPQHTRSTSQPPYIPPTSSGASYYVINPLSPSDPPPVPDAIPVGPGDPRLGGRLCMRCGGAGTRAVMLFDMVTCEYCSGTGRVWR